jgi:hypothetical protein
MITTKALWDLDESKLVTYPRNDDEPVVGLNTERYVVVTVNRKPLPTYDPTVEFLVPSQGIDLEALKYIYEWLVEPLPIPPPPLPPGPNYYSFYAALLVSDVYQAVLTEVLSAVSPAPAGALAVFVSAMQDCLALRANPDAMQQAIWLLLTQLNLDEKHLAELQQMLEDANLASVYVLTPPAP